MEGNTVPVLLSITKECVGPRCRNLPCSGAEAQWRRLDLRPLFNDYFTNLNRESFWCSRQGGLLTYSFNLDSTLPHSGPSIATLEFVTSCSQVLLTGEASDTDSSGD